MRCATVLAAALAMTGTTACSAHNRDSENTVAFVCTARGDKFATSGMDPASICAVFKTEIERALSIVTVASADTSGVGDWISIDVSAPSQVTVMASVTQRFGGRETRLPDMTVDVSDKPIGVSDIGMLAAQVARTVAETAEN